MQYNCRRVRCVFFIFYCDGVFFYAHARIGCLMDSVVVLMFLRGVLIRISTPVVFVVVV